MLRYNFCIVSKDSNFKISRENFNEFSNCSVEFVTDNSRPITKVYNEFLLKIRSLKNSDDVVVFMHADVQLDIKKLLSNVERCIGKYQIMGLCGTEVMNVSQSPLNWYTSSRPTPEKRWGCVTHGEINNQKSFFSCHHPDVLDHEVACIDGLCIIFGPKAVQSDLTFDEQFSFDQYDSDISLLAVINYKFKVGVLVHTELLHWSVGKSILTEEFLKHEKDLRKKWNIELN